jgi:hypothetical protein
MMKFFGDVIFHIHKNPSFLYTKASFIINCHLLMFFLKCSKIKIWYGILYMYIVTVILWVLTEPSLHEQVF